MNIISLFFLLFVSSISSLQAQDIFGFEKVVLSFNENLEKNFFYQCEYRNYAAYCAGNDEFSAATLRFQCQSKYYPIIQIDAVVRIKCNHDAPSSPTLEQFQYQNLKMLDIKYSGDMKVTTYRNEHTLSTSIQDFVLTSLREDYGFSCPAVPRDLSELELIFMSSKKNKYIYPCQYSGHSYEVIFKAKKAKNTDLYEQIHEIYFHTLTN